MSNVHEKNKDLEKYSQKVIFWQVEIPGVALCSLILNI